MSLVKTLEKSINIINSGIGRDKCCRIIQYLLMALLPHLKNKGAHYHNLVQRLIRLKSSMSLTRKVLRFGKEIPLITGIRNRLAAHEKSPQRMIFWRTLSDLSLILYFFTDHPLYLESIGFWRYDKTLLKNLDYINNVFWLLSSIFDIMCTLVEMHHLQMEIKDLKGKVKHVACQEGDEQFEIRAQLKQKKILYVKQCLNLARNVIDLPVIFYFMDSPRITATQAGLLGGATSAISLYNMWGS